MTRIPVNTSLLAFTASFTPPKAQNAIGVAIGWEKLLLEAAKAALYVQVQQTLGSASQPREKLRIREERVDGYNAGRKGDLMHKAEEEQKPAQEQRTRTERLRLPRLERHGKENHPGAKRHVSAKALSKLRLVGCGIFECVRIEGGSYADEGRGDDVASCNALNMGHTLMIDKSK